MNNTIKVSLIILVIIAGFVVFRILFIFSKQLDVAIARPVPIAIDYEDTDDFDNDGLSNNDEAFWNTDPYNPDTDGDGFLDGEEVLSGHNPILASADDVDDTLGARSRLIAVNSENGGNLTGGIADLIVAGFVAGDLSRDADDATYNNAIETISLAAIYDTLDVLEGVVLQEENFNVVEPTTENQQAYVNKISGIIQDDLMDILFGQPEDVNRLFILTPDIFDNENQTKIKNVFLGHATSFQEAYQELFDFPVPQNWLVIHQQGLLLLKKIEVHYRSIALANDDPFKMLITLSNLQTVYIEINPLLNKISRAIEINNLSSPNSSLFNIVNNFSF